ncbi:hypothetical protein LOD99_1869 [Oopsacas minuta]|uniref:OTU domain-containing protein n=1 Tax=Oopsacas minuta TaxID=111878 RepID=A0AAV7K3A8_9METZ|nr:hypothetical protein LOD99_1869 [Oopsacas minuta]
MDSSVAKYLMKSQMDGNTVWATDIEIFATSAMLGVNIFVPNDYSEYHKQRSETKWNRYHSFSDWFSSTALYLTNYEEHFEPVIDLIHSRTLHILTPTVLVMR